MRFVAYGAHARAWLTSRFDRRHIKSTRTEQPMRFVNVECSPAQAEESIVLHWQMAPCCSATSDNTGPSQHHYLESRIYPAPRTSGDKRLSFL